MKTDEAYNLTEKEFQAARASRMEALSRALTAQCEALPHLLQTDAQAKQYRGYQPSTTKAAELFEMIKQTHQQLIGETYSSAYTPARAEGRIMKTGIERIAAERQRQITEEKWSDEHDDGHDDGELARAAAVYALPGKMRSATDGKGSFYGTVWPWDDGWFKGSPSTGLPVNLLHFRVRELEKAGALIAAEIDRLQRIPVGKFFPESP